MKVYTKCSNYASKTCPCALAEYGHCIVCSMCRGENFCDCDNTVSYCIYNELINNGGHALDQNHIVRCRVIYEKTFGKDYKFLRLKVPTVDISAFKLPGTFVFVRTLENTFYDVPISVIYEYKEVDSIAIIVQMRGIKTKTFEKLTKGDFIFLRGPYYNGLQGVKYVANLKQNKALVLCRGIGVMPSLHVIGKLMDNHNDVDIYLDPAEFDRNYLALITELFELNVHKISICDKGGNLTKELSEVIDKSVKSGSHLIHLGMSDYLITKCVDLIEDKYNREVDLSCINNVHMSCGEGICGVCTKNRDAKNIVHLCKEQMDVYDYRKLI